MSGWLTEPPTSKCLELHPKQKKQIYPEDTHEMPIARGGIQSTSSQHGLAQLHNHARQPAQAAHQMQRMGDRQDIEERVADVRGDPETLGFQLQPGVSLARNEEH